MKRSWISILAFFVIMLLAGSALGVLTTDSTNIGKHPNYSTSYSAFWRTNADYSAITDGTHTWFNGPGSGGSINFRSANSCTNCLTDPSGGQSMAYFDSSSNLTVGNQITAGHGVGHAALAIHGTSQFYDTITATEILTVNSGAIFEMDGTNSSIVLFGSGSTASKPGGGSWSATSDVRVKKNEAPYTSGLSAIRGVRPVIYSYNGLGGMPNDDVRYVGVNAQDLERVAPLMVSSRKGKLHPDDAQTTDIKQVDPSAFTFMLINAVQELDAKVKRLEAERCK